MLVSVSSIVTEDVGAREVDRRDTVDDGNMADVVEDMNVGLVSGIVDGSFLSDENDPILLPNRFPKRFFNSLPPSSVSSSSSPPSLVKVDSVEDGRGLVEDEKE